MESNEYRSIDDILNDPDLDDLIEPVEEKKKRISVNPDVQSLHEIEEWVRKNARMPQNSEDNLNERSMYHKLLGLQKKASELREYDSLGLLVEEEPTAYDKLNDEIKKDVNGGGFNSLDDVLNDDSVLFEDLDDVDPEEINFFNTTKVTRKQRNSSGANVKRNQVDDFSEYKKMFKQVQRELASGLRKFIPFKNYNIVLHHYYLLKNQLIYIESFGEDVQKYDRNRKYDDRRVHVIYENGTENNVWYHGLGASLYGRGKAVSDIETGEVNLTGDDYKTGYIYVLKSLSEDPQIANIKSLYKIGFTKKSVSQRIANAENESTYLYAPVKVVEQFQVINLDPEKLETAIHHVLEDYRLDVSIKAPNGKVITPREWFVIDLPKVEEIVNAIVTKLQSEQ